jgi:cytochrome c
MLLGAVATAAASFAAAAELRGHGGAVRAIAVGVDGSTAITGSFDSTAIVWSLGTGAAQDVLRFHHGQVTPWLRFPAGAGPAAARTGRIAIWAAGEDKPAQTLEGHTAPVVGLALSPDGQTLASASWDATVRIWPLSGGMGRVLTGHKANVNAVAFTADGTLVSAGYDASLIVWRAQRAQWPARSRSPRR